MGTETAGKNITRSQRGPTRRRLWLFRLLAVTVIPILVLLLAELALRVAGVGHSPRAFVKSEVEGDESYFNNPDFSRRFFPAV